MFYGFVCVKLSWFFVGFAGYRGNNPADKIKGMNLHLWLAIVCYCIQLVCKTVKHDDLDLKDVVHKNFILNNGLMSLPNVSYSISLMKRRKSVIKHEGQIRLYKITSNQAAVMGAFDVNGHWEQLKDRDYDNTYHNPLYFTDVYVYGTDSEKNSKLVVVRDWLITANSIQ